ncbi:hypothetical protein [Brachyspira sp. G79]|uniref:tetratricopeptide repeat protein n=1 Tax=Brachyspira sp. G79 TaxID=1358104 RepID=UPI000BBCEE59|nr:hypothetical protein [Brachyspira sp. G79]PCG20926.1 hypothetical protein KQ44_00510 [Brachyspira sp. G79]
MKRIFLIFNILVLSTLYVYAQGQSLNVPNRTADTARTVTIDTNMYSSLFNGKLEPAWVYIGEAKRAIYNGDIPYALYIMNKTVMYYPNNADAHYFLGLIYEKEGGSPAEQGGAASYRLAIEEYRKAINLATNLTIPAYKLDAYFSLLYIYEKLIDENNYANIEKEIIAMAENTYVTKEKGRIYFRLAEHYGNRNRGTAAIDYYRQSYLNGYRQKLSLFRMSLIYRRMRNYVQEKETLTLASKYSFDNVEPSNFEVEKAIVQRLEALKNVRIPKKLN